MKGAFVAFVSFYFAAVTSAVEPPTAVHRGGWVDISLSGTILDDARVRQRVESGLTAILLVLDRTTRERPPSGAQLAIRWEPWDEVFFVSVLHADGSRKSTTVSDFEGLRAYLRNASLRIRQDTARAQENLAVEVRLVPFSSGEARDAREWFLDTLGATPKGSSGGGMSSVEAIVDVLLATSIQARPVAAWTWTIPITAQGGGDP